MKARLLIQSAPYGPDEVKALGQVFEDVWARIAPTVSSRAEAVEAARLKLAGVILDLAKRGNFNPQHLAGEAIKTMYAPPQKLRP